MNNIQKIELTEAPKNDRGYATCYKLITVDGIAWGRVYQKSHGMRGNSYTFEQMHGETVMREREKWSNERYRFEDVTVRSASKKSWPRHNEADTRSTKQRITDEIAKLIAEGLLIHPDIQKAEVEKRRAAYAAAQAAGEARENAEFEAKAREALDAAMAPGSCGPAERLAPIVAAMRWAQTR